MLWTEESVSNHENFINERASEAGWRRSPLSRATASPSSDFGVLIAVADPLPHGRGSLKARCVWLFPTLPHLSASSAPSANSAYLRNPAGPVAAVPSRDHGTRQRTDPKTGQWHMSAAPGNGFHRRGTTSESSVEPNDVGATPPQFAELTASVSSLNIA